MDLSNWLDLSEEDGSYFYVSFPELDRSLQLWLPLGLASSFHFELPLALLFLLS